MQIIVLAICDNLLPRLKRTDTANVTIIINSSVEVLSMEQRREYKYILSNRLFVCLCIYYGILLLLGMFGVIKVILLVDFRVGVISNTLWGSFSAAVMCSAIEYLRRLYKAKINNNVLYNNADCEDKGKSAGYAMYFFLRPIISCVLVLALILALSSGIFIFTAPLDVVINNRFLYFCVLLSCVIGLLTGRVIDKIIGLTNKALDGLFRDK